MVTQQTFKIEKNLKVKLLHHLPVMTISDFEFQNKTGRSHSKIVLIELQLYDVIKISMNAWKFG